MSKSVEYKIKVIEREGASCVSLVNGLSVYTCNGKPDPEGTIETYKQKKKKRFRILKKLGIWLENGENSAQQKKQK